MKKTTLYLSSLMFVAMLFGSCETDKPDGLWDDIIKLSTTSVEFTESNTATVTTQGEWWWILHVEINDVYYRHSYQSNMYDRENITIEANWLTVERTDSKTLKISATKNVTNQSRTAKINLEAGDYFDQITVTQPMSSTPISDAKLIPFAITSHSGAISSPRTDQVSRFTYDDQKRIQTIVWQNITVGANMPISTSTFEYGENQITVTKTSSDEAVETKVTVYQIRDGKVYADDADPIAIDNAGRAVRYNYVYDAKGNITSYDYFGDQERNQTVEYDNANGVFRYVNMPSWFLSAYLMVMYGELNLYNNALNVWPTAYMGHDYEPRINYEMTYNSDDYPTQITLSPVNIIGGGYSSWEIEYVPR